MTLADNENEKILVGPNFYAEARLSDKGIEADDDSEHSDDENESESDKDKRIDEAKKKIDEKHRSKFPHYFPSKNNNEKQIEPVGSEYEYVDNRLIPSNLDVYYNYLNNPYLLPPHNYMQYPIINQYLQRRAFNAYRYPFSFNQQVVPYPSYYYVQ